MDLILKFKPCSSHLSPAPFSLPVIHFLFHLSEKKINAEKNIFCDVFPKIFLKEKMKCQYFCAAEQSYDMLPEQCEGEERTVTP